MHQIKDQNMVYNRSLNKDKIRLKSNRKQMLKPQRNISTIASVKDNKYVIHEEIHLISKRKCKAYIVTNETLTLGHEYLC